MTIEAQLQALVNTFVADVAQLARQAAMDTISGLLANVVLPPAAVVVRPPPPRPGGAGLGGRAARGAKRGAPDLESLQARIRGYVRDNPGQRVTQINAALATTTADLRLPLAKLIAAGELRTMGQKRGTQYFVT